MMSIASPISTSSCSLATFSSSVENVESLLIFLMAFSSECFCRFRSASITFACWWTSFISTSHSIRRFASPGPRGSHLLRSSLMNSYSWNPTSKSVSFSFLVVLYPGFNVWIVLHMTVVLPAAVSSLRA